MTAKVRLVVPQVAPPNAEIEALDALRRGDQHGALTILMRAYGDGVYQFCRRSLRDDTLAADVHQQCFIQAFEDLPRFSGRSTVKTWLFGIANHRCLDALKSRRRLLAHVEECAEIPELQDPAPKAEEGMIRNALERALQVCLQALAPATALAVSLRYKEGFTYEQMSEICGEKPGTLQARVARSMPVLKECLEKRGVSP